MKDVKYVLAGIHIMQWVVVKAAGSGVDGLLFSALIVSGSAAFSFS